MCKQRVSAIYHSCVCADVYDCSSLCSVWSHISLNLLTSVTNSFKEMFECNIKTSFIACILILLLLSVLTARVCNMEPGYSLQTSIFKSNSSAIQCRNPELMNACAVFKVLDGAFLGVSMRSQGALPKNGTINLVILLCLYLHNACTESSVCARTIILVTHARSHVFFIHNS